MTTAQQDKPAPHAANNNDRGQIESSALNALQEIKTDLISTPILNKDELRSVRSIIAYLAYNTETSERLYEEILFSRYGIADVTALPSHYYNEAVKLLVDTDIKAVMN